MSNPEPSSPQQQQSLGDPLRPSSSSSSATALGGHYHEQQAAYVEDGPEDTESTPLTMDVDIDSHTQTQGGSTEGDDENTILTGMDHDRIHSRTGVLNEGVTSSSSISGTSSGGGYRPPISSRSHEASTGPPSTSTSTATENGNDDALSLPTHTSTPYSSTAPVNMTAARGLPMLSGAPPIMESESCRTCGKTFIPLFRRAHTCNHCGYQYCESDCSESALLPRTAGGAARLPGSSGGVSGSGRGGYDMVEVCKLCFGNLQITSGHIPYLRSLPLKRLQAYTKAYNLPTANALEKEDFVQTIVRARSPITGCLSHEQEAFYRRRSVPKQGVLPTVRTPQPQPHGRLGASSTASSSSSARPTTNGSSARPAPQPQYRPQAQPTSARPPTQQQPYRPQQQQQQQQQQQYRPQQSAPRPVPQSQSQPRPPPKPAQAAAPRPPSPPVPTIASLVPLPTSYLSTLSIGTLKAILYDNHVKVDFSLVLEKGDLVKRVTELVKDERKHLERLAREEALEEAAAAGLSLSPPNTNSNGMGEDEARKSTDGSSPGVDIPTGPQASVERDGLCVVCQENDATLAVVDCGHLSMCSECAGLVMKTSRECPMCRTRIITEQRLIRIFRA